MRIIRKPKLEEEIVRCTTCGCVFAYTIVDIHRKESGLMIGSALVCPICGRNKWVDEFEVVQPEELEDINEKKE